MFRQIGAQEKVRDSLQFPQKNLPVLRFLFIERFVIPYFFDQLLSVHTAIIPQKKTAVHMHRRYFRICD